MILDEGRKKGTEDRVKRRWRVEPNFGGSICEWELAHVSVFPQLKYKFPGMN